MLLQTAVVQLGPSVESSNSSSEGSRLNASEGFHWSREIAQYPGSPDGRHQDQFLSKVLDFELLLSLLDLLKERLV